MNEYESQKDSILDKNYYLSGEQINDLYIHSLTPNAFHPLLACQDNSLKILSSGKELTKFDTKSSVNCLTTYSQDVKFPTTKSSLEKTMILGLSDGSLINLAMSISTPVLLWSLKASTDINRSSAGILLAFAYDFTRNGLNDIMIARDDASLELYAMNINGEMEMQWREVLKDAVTGIDCGLVSKANLNEFVVSTYSGRVMGIGEREEEKKGGEGKGRKEKGKEIEMKIKMMRGEIDKLKKNIDDINAIDNSESSLVKFN